MNIPDSTQQLINEFAAEYGLSAADVKCMAIGTAFEIEKMRSTQVFIDNPEYRVTLCELGIIDHCKKFDLFVSAYKSYDSYRQTVQRFVHHELVGAA